MQSSFPWPTIGISYFSIVRAAKNSEKCCSWRCYFARWKSFEIWKLIVREQQSVFNFSLRLRRKTIEACYRIQRLRCFHIAKYMMYALFDISILFSVLLLADIEMYFCEQYALFMRMTRLDVLTWARVRGTHAVTFWNLYSKDWNRLGSMRMNCRPRPWMQIRVGVHFEYRSRSEKSRLEWSIGSATSYILSTKSAFRWF